MFKVKCYDDAGDGPCKCLSDPSNDVLTCCASAARQYGRPRFEDVVAHSVDCTRYVCPVSGSVATQSRPFRGPAGGSDDGLISRSKSSVFNGPGLRARGVVKKERGHAVRHVFRPVAFARGTVAIYVCDVDANGVLRVCDAQHVVWSRLFRSQCVAARFGERALPARLQFSRFGPSTTTSPDTLRFLRRNGRGPSMTAFVFKRGVRSWSGPPLSNTGWVASLFGELCLHETLVSHMRRLFNGGFYVHASAERFNNANGARNTTNMVNFD